MLPPICIVVPTYWTRATAEHRDGDAIYDHPTAVGGPSTLTALLPSLAALDTSTFYLLLLVAVTGEDVALEAEEAVRDLVAGYPSVTTVVFGATSLQRLHACFDSMGLENARGFLDLREYPKIRNLQLALPLALQSQAIVALDDDEIVTDPSFMLKVKDALGRSIDGAEVQGLSGHYEQEDGSILLKTDPSKLSSPNLFDRKAAIMNEATEMLESRAGEVVRTPFCFGGNMEFTPGLARSVGFDPGITRGEDIDYLLNARMEGMEFFLRKDLRILHRPPPGGSYLDTSTSKLEQDVIRFLYEREKLRVSQEHGGLHAVTAESLQPYPGRFLQADLEDNAREALESAGYRGDARAFIARVIDGLPARIDNYLRFREQWPAAMERVGGSAQVRDLLLAQVQNG